MSAGAPVPADGPVPAPAEPLLDVRGVGQRFGSVTALNSVSFTVGHNEVVGLIGPNGAGKTTMVNAITGTQTGWTGDIRFAGASLRRTKPYRIGRMGISRTFQIAQPFGSMTVLENVMVGAMFGGSGPAVAIAAARGAAREFLDLVGIVHKASAPAVSLNVPERKRLEIARALAMGPRLLLLDEVMAGLNSTEIAQSCELIRQIRQRDIAILIIEHVMKAIVAVSDRIVVLHHGEKLVEGAPAEVMGDAAVVKAYLGARFQGQAGQGSRP